MDTLQFNGEDIPLLEAPHKENSEAPRRILYVVFKHRSLITAIFLALSLPIFVIWLLSPTDYVASAKIMLKPNRAYLNVNPTGQNNLLRVDPSPELINSEIQIIRSREVLQRLAQEMPFPEETNGVPRRNPEADIKRKAGKINKVLKVTPVRLTNLIQISLETPEGEWAAKAVNRLAEIYLEEHVKVHKTQGVEQFYDEQEKKLYAEMLQSETKLKEYQEREGIVDAGIEVTANLTALATFERALRETESAIRETEERVAILSAQLKDQRENVKSGATTSTSPVYAKIRERLVQLELERNSLLQRYTPQNRLVMDKEKEIAELNESLSREIKKMTGSESASLNNIHDGILNSFLASKAQLQGLKEKRAVLTNQVSNYSSLAADKKKKSYEYDRLQQEVLAKKEALALYKRRAEEARISDAMDEVKFGNAAIFERASLPLGTADFNPLIIIFAIVFVSMGIAVAVAFAIEFLNTTLRDETDIEKRLGLPVLATIQYHGS